jgi:hypothetical protein
VPLNIDLSNRGSVSFANIEVTITWDATKLQYQRNSPGSWVDSNGDNATVTVNAGSASTGTFRVSGFANEATAASVTNILLRNLVLRPIAAGAATVTANVTAAANAGGTFILSSVTVRNLTITTP